MSVMSPQLPPADCHPGRTWSPPRNINTKVCKRAQSAPPEVCNAISLAARVRKLASKEVLPPIAESRTVTQIPTSVASSAEQNTAKEVATSEVQTEPSVAVATSATQTEPIPETETFVKQDAVKAHELWVSKVKQAEITLQALLIGCEVGGNLPEFVNHAVGTEKRFLKEPSYDESLFALRRLTRLENREEAIALLQEECPELKEIFPKVKARGERIDAEKPFRGTVAELEAYLKTWAEARGFPTNGNDP